MRGFGFALSLAGYTARKIMGAVFTLIFLAVLVFLLGRLTPGDEAVVAAGPGASPEQIEAVRERLGLAGSLWDQFLAYMGRLGRGDLGVSSSTQGPVADALWSVMPSTAELVLVAILISVSVAIPLALLSAARSSGAGDALRRVLIIVAAGMPIFWLALLMQNLIAVQWKLLPISGIASLGVSVPRVTGMRLIDSLLYGSPIAFTDALAHIILPAAILAVPFTGHLYRVIRSELLRVMEREHILVARATGISSRRLLWGHALPQVVNPALLMVGVEFATLFGGAILVESVFGRPGFGSFMTNAVAQKDTSSVLGGVLVIGVIVVVTSLIVDTIQIIRDPRVRAQQLGRQR